MFVLSVIVFRFLILLKWFFQIVGVFISLFILHSDASNEFVAFISLFFIIVPELIMASFIWIIRGAYSACERGFPKKISVLGNKGLCFSSMHYVASLSGLGLSLGYFIDVPILIFVIFIILSITFFEKINLFVSRYLEFN